MPFAKVGTRFPVPTRRHSAAFNLPSRRAAAFERHPVSQVQKLAQHQLQNPSVFAPGCTQLHLVAEKRPKTKIFLRTAKTAKINLNGMVSTLQLARGARPPRSASRRPVWSFR